ncbi:MAG: hypothetical protein GXP37_12275 [Chloroflexi bacterium]|nr:hypothetical protein [Chloroflexota bacterium]
MDLNLGQWAVIGLSAILIIGYIRGYASNRGKAEAITRWLQEGLSAWGTVTPGARLSGMVSGARLRVERAATPFARVEAIFILEPRENLLFWLGTRLQGRRDQLVLRIDFRSKPLYVAEVGTPRDRDFKRAVAAMKEPIVVPAGDDDTLQIAIPQKHRPGTTAAIQRFLAQGGPAVLRLTLQNSRPNLILRANMPALQQDGAQTFIAAVAALQHAEP